MAEREYDKPKHYGGVDESERPIDKIIIRDDFGQVFRIGLHDFFCVPGLNGNVTLARRIDEMRIGAFVGESIELQLPGDPDTGEPLRDKPYMQPTGYLWIYEGRLPENLTEMYRHLDAELKKIGR